MPKTLLLLSFVLILFILSCTQPAKNVNSTAKDSTSALSTVPGMPGYVYFDSTMSPRDTINYIDTFSLNGQRFRILHNYTDTTIDTEYDRLEQLTGNGWQHLLLFSNGRFNGCDHTKDVNGDGYIDFLEDWRHGSYAHFYLPDKKTFDTAVSFDLLDWKLIDTARNIYCQNENIKGRQGESTLYTFEGVKPVILYTMEFEMDTAAENPHVYKSMSLYKNIPNFKDSAILVNTTQIKPDDETDEFEYDEYWRKNYKQLLGIK